MAGKRGPGHHLRTHAIEGAVAIDGVGQELPCQAAGAALAPIAEVGPAGHEIGHGGVGMAEVPRVFEQEFEYLGAGVETLEGGTHTQHVGEVGRGETVEAGMEVVEVAHKHGVAAEVAEVAPDEGLAVEGIGVAPYFGLLAEIVEQHHPPPGNGGEVGFEPLGCPLLAFVVEDP